MYFRLNNDVNSKSSVNNTTTSLAELETEELKKNTYYIVISEMNFLIFKPQKKTMSKVRLILSCDLREVVVFKIKSLFEKISKIGIQFQCFQLVEYLEIELSNRHQSNIFFTLIEKRQKALANQFKISHEDFLCKREDKMNSNNIYSEFFFEDVIKHQEKKKNIVIKRSDIRHNTYSESSINSGYNSNKSEINSSGMDLSSIRNDAKRGSIKHMLLQEENYFSDSLGGVDNFKKINKIKITKHKNSVNSENKSSLNLNNYNSENKNLQISGCKSTSKLEIKHKSMNNGENENNDNSVSSYNLNVKDKVESNCKEKHSHSDYNLNIKYDIYSVNSSSSQNDFYNRINDFSVKSLFKFKNSSQIDTYVLANNNEELEKMKRLLKIKIYIYHKNCNNKGMTMIKEIISCLAKEIIYLYQILIEAYSFLKNDDEINKNLISLNEFINKAKEIKFD